MKKRIIILVVSLLLLASLCACGSSGEKNAEVDYNHFIYRQGYVALTEEAYLFHDPLSEWNELRFLTADLSAPVMTLCARADCAHGSEDCAARFEAQSIYAWNNQLYYISEDSVNKTGRFALYRMDVTGENRIKLLELPELEWESSWSLMYQYYVGDGFLLLSCTKDNGERACCTLWLYNLADLKEEPKELFRSEEGAWSIRTMSIQEGLVLYAVERVLDVETARGECALYCYDLAAETASLLVEEWQNRNSFTVERGVFYWCAINRGIYSVNLSDGTVNEIITYGEQTAGAQGMDDQYIYFSYAGTEPRVVICDYEGNELMEFSYETVDERPVYHFSTEDKVFFSYRGTRGANLYSMPVCYLEKDAIATGDAEWNWLIEQE